MNNPPQERSLSHLQISKLIPKVMLKSCHPFSTFFASIDPAFESALEYHTLDFYTILRLCTGLFLILNIIGKPTYTSRSSATRRSTVKDYERNFACLKEIIEARTAII